VLNELVSVQPKLPGLVLRWAGEGSGRRLE